MNAFDSTSESNARCEVCPLSRVKAGVAVRIKQLCAAPEVQTRLREIGLCEDHIIKLVTSHTNFICQVCNARLAISEKLAQLILVEPVEAQSRLNCRTNGGRLETLSRSEDRISTIRSEDQPTRQLLDSPRRFINSTKIL